jgi:hypothetical protein
MSNELVLQLTPEDEELQRKSAELATLETELVQGELDLTTGVAELMYDMAIESKKHYSK